MSAAKRYVSSGNSSPGWHRDAGSGAYWRNDHQARTVVRRKELERGAAGGGRLQRCAQRQVGQGGGTPPGLPTRMQRRLKEVLLFDCRHLPVHFIGLAPTFVTNWSALLIVGTV
jgi:hypothetical protein